VMVGFFRGFHCPFCRRHIAQLALTRDKLAEEGVETVAIVNTPLSRARQYFQYRPTRMALAADPEVKTHRAYGLGHIELLPDSTDPSQLQWPRTSTVAQLLATSINPTGELPEPMNLMAASELLNRRDGFEPTEADKQVQAMNPTQRTGHFLIDPKGVILWVHAEAADGPNQLAGFPSEDEMLAVARTVTR